MDTLLELEEETRDAVEKARKELVDARSIQKRSSTFTAQVREDVEELDKEFEHLDAVTPLPNRRFSQSREMVSLSLDLDVSMARKRRSNTDFSNVADSGGAANGVDSLKLDPSGAESTAETEETYYPNTKRHWDLANRVVLNSERPWSIGRRRYRKIADGRWRWTSLRSWWNYDGLLEDNEFRLSKNVKPSTKKVINSLIEQQKYAVVTFTSRQAGKMKTDWSFRKQTLLNANDYLFRESISRIGPTVCC